MPKIIPETELMAIEEILRNRPNGAGIADLVGSKATEAQRRSMHRRLKKLEQLGRISNTGASKHMRYFLPGRPTSPTFIHEADARVEADGGLFVPVSKAGLEIQKSLRLDQSARKPVGYKREFLSSYRPNSTYYLSTRERRFLSDASRSTAAADQPAGTYARQILNRLLIDLSWNSSRLEGNTYSILDTHVLLEKGTVAEGKTAAETQMLLNHKDAIEFLVESAEEIGFNRHTLLNLHGLLSFNLLADPEASGRLRRKIVEIGKSVYTPLQTPSIIEECFSELLAKATAIKDPFEQSLFAAIQIPYLQPFDDVNKRVSRLAANIPFIKGNLSPISFVDVEERIYVDAMLAIYELNRTELARDMFVWAYDRSAQRYASLRQSLGEPDPFRIKYRDKIRAAISEVVRSKLGKSDASKVVDAFASDSVSQGDQTHFVEVVETELIGLHEGNFARYRIRPSEFFAWKAVWEAA